MKRRKYRQKRRADKTDQTRRRIVQAAVQLHEELGPAQTSIKAIAEHAGVQRLTVYRHFPDEASLFKACTSCWLETHPLPAADDWADVVDPEQRTATALLTFYRYYRKNERMWTLAYRDMDDVAALQLPMAAVDACLDQIRDELLSVWKINPKDKRQLSLTLRHCLRFSTWLSLKKEGLPDKKMVGLVMGWLGGRL